MRSLLLLFALAAAGPAVAQSCPDADLVGAPLVERVGDACAAVVPFEAEAGEVLWFTWSDPDVAAYDADGDPVGVARVDSAEVRSADGTYSLQFGTVWEVKLRMPVRGAYQFRVYATPAAGYVDPRVQSRSPGAPGQPLPLVPELPRHDDDGPLLATASTYIEAGTLMPFDLVWSSGTATVLGVTGPGGAVRVDTSRIEEQWDTDVETWVEASISGDYRFQVAIERAAALQPNAYTALSLMGPHPAEAYRAKRAAWAAEAEAERREREAWDAETGITSDIQLDLTDAPPPPPPPPPPPVPPPPRQTGDGG